MEKTDIRSEMVFHLLFQRINLTQRVAPMMVTRSTASLITWRYNEGRFPELSAQ
jgi:hypothetical protein